MYMNVNCKYVYHPSYYYLLWEYNLANKYTLHNNIRQFPLLCLLFLLRNSYTSSQIFYAYKFIKRCVCHFMSACLQSTNTKTM